MTVTEWLAKVRAGRPPLSPAQIAALRPIGQQMAAHMKAAPAHAEAAPSTTTEHSERITCNAPR